MGVLDKEYDAKSEIIGPEDGDGKQACMLNRIVTWEEDGIAYEADQRHAQLIVEGMGMSEAKAVTTPGVNEEEPREDSEEAQELLGEDAATYRALSARANFLAQDRVDIVYAVKEASRMMAKPRKHDWNKLKRLARYLKDRPRMVT